MGVIPYARPCYSGRHIAPPIRHTAAICRPLRPSPGYPRLSPMQSETMPRLDTSWGLIVPIDGSLAPLPVTSETFHGWGLILREPFWALAWPTGVKAPRNAEIPTTVMGWGHGWTWALFREDRKPSGGRVRQIQRLEGCLTLDAGSKLAMPPTPGYFWAELGEKPIWTQEIAHAVKPPPAHVVHQTRPIVDVEVEAYLAENPHATRLDVYHALGRRQTAIRASLNRLGYRVPGR